MRRLWRLIKWTLLLLIVAVALLLAPAVYVETACRADAQPGGYKPIITDAQWQRAEANTYLTYPEWHIVYAYEGLATVLVSGDEHRFSYLSSIASFWRSFCLLNREADRHGGADFAARATIHTIGVSFTLEMALKAAYEETLGRLAALWRGAEKTLQDAYAAQMAADYAAFLQQTPWYKYDFPKANAELWALPADSLRGWERRLALGTEWWAKSQYAKLIAGAVAATGEAQLRIRSAVTGSFGPELEGAPGIELVETKPDAAIIETLRYRAFTRILQQLALAGVPVIEIAGNDDIMVSAIADRALPAGPPSGTLIARIGRDGSPTDRLLIGVKVAELNQLLAEMAAMNIPLEHVYDY